MGGSNSLVQEIHKVENLYAAWSVVRRCSATSKGTDGVTIAEVAKAPLSYLSEISRKLSGGTYEFSALMPCPVKKPGGKTRPLEVPTVCDRIVLRAMYDAVEPLVRHRIGNPCSYGYVKGRRLGDAVDHIVASVDGGRDWVLESDIRTFFVDVDRRLLRQKLDALFGEDRLLMRLLEKAVDISLGDTSHLEPEEAAAFPASGCGIPQGGGLSPLFANVYLLEFDEAMLGEGLDLVRWADDFVVLCRSEEQAWEALGVAEEALAKVKLALHPAGGENGKTGVVRYFSGFDFLGLRFSKDGIVPCREKENEWRKRVWDTCKDARSVLGLLTDLKRFLQGWLAAYRACRGERSERLWSGLNGELVSAVQKHLGRLGVRVREGGDGAGLLTRLGLPVCGA